MNVIAVFTCFRLFFSETLEISNLKPRNLHTSYFRAPHVHYNEHS